MRSLIEAGVSEVDGGAFQFIESRQSDMHVECVPAVQRSATSRRAVLVSIAAGVLKLYQCLLVHGGPVA